MNSNNQWFRNGFVYLLILVTLAALAFNIFQQPRQSKQIAISDLAQDIKNGEVSKVSVNGAQVTATYNTGEVKTTSLNKNQTTSFEQTMSFYGVTDKQLSAVRINNENPPQWDSVIALLSTILPFLLIGGLFFFLMRQAQSGNNQALSFGKSRARMFSGDKPTVTFADVAGVEEAKVELQEVVEFLKEPDKFTALGARIPKGVLLVGPPGTGKTLLARAVAGEANVPFFSISGSEFVEMFVGVGASRVRDLSDTAKRNSPCIVFVNEAAILAARRNKKAIGMLELQESVEKVIAGPERKSRLISDDEKKVIAYHEAGHALVMRMLPNCDPVHKVSIVSRGMALGFTMHLPEDDRYLERRSKFMDDLSGLLGGRAAEEIVFKDVTTGAANDLERATDMARAMVTRYGMSEKLGPRPFGNREELVFLGREISEQRNYSEEVAQQIDAEVKAIITHAYDRAKDILNRYRHKLDELSERLIKVETVDAAEFEAMFQDQPQSERPSYVPIPAAAP